MVVNCAMAYLQSTIEGILGSRSSVDNVCVCVCCPDARSEKGEKRDAH